MSVSGKVRVGVFLEIDAVKCFAEEGSGRWPETLNTSRPRGGRERDGRARSDNVGERVGVKWLTKIRRS